MSNGAPVVPRIVSGIDPEIGLATTMQAGKGVYALLLGSGISSAAGIPTGWTIVTELVRHAAIASGDVDASRVAELDVHAWWQEHGDGQELGYSNVLSSLSSTPGGRSQILREFFEASEQDRLEGRKVPTQAHDAIADLVASGYIRVIVTTNFDRLLERALESRGISVQVIHSEEQVQGRTPLVHAPVTIVKLHGDQADLDKRNTIDELGEYPPQLTALLRTILDEFGLLVCGWSGEWDSALVAALEATRPRRYPMFWSFRSPPSEIATRLAAQFRADPIMGKDANALFMGLRQRLQALESMASLPLTRDLAVTQLKRALPDPVRRIETHDLLTQELRKVEVMLTDEDRYPKTFGPILGEEFWPRFDELLRRYREDCDVLLHMLANGAYFAGPEHNDLWTLVTRRLLTARNTDGGPWHERLRLATDYPALLAVTTLLGAGALAGREDLAGPVLLKPLLRRPTMSEDQSACQILNHYVVFHDDNINLLPRLVLPGQQWRYPASHLLRADLDDVLATLDPDNARRSTALSEAEYLFGLAQIAVGDRACPADFVLPLRYTAGPLPISNRLRATAVQPSAPLVQDMFAGDAGRAVKALDELDTFAKGCADRQW